MKCDNCKIEFEPKRKDAKFCSPKCRKEAFQKRSLGTDNVDLAERIIDEPERFEFTVPYNKTPQDENGQTTKGYDSEVEKQRKKVRTALYWYDVPIAAIPILKEDWPEMPDFMNGRQYFLWWKNDFLMNGDVPEILNPFPVHTDVKYFQAGEGSRRWGA